MNNLKTNSDDIWDELCKAEDDARSQGLRKATDTLQIVHPFESTLGKGPYTFKGLSAATVASRCAHCRKPIKNLYTISIGNGTLHTVGSECVLSLGNGFSAYLVGQVKVAKSRFEKQQRKAREAKKQAAEAKENLKYSLEQHPAECAFLMEYTGNFNFYLSLKSQLETRGALSEKQWDCITNVLIKMSTPKEPRIFSLATGTTIVVSKFLAFKIGEQFKLNRPHFSLEVISVLNETDKAYQIEAKLSANRTAHCCACGLLLTNPESVANGIGPVCADGWEVANIEELIAKFGKIETTIQLWIPKSQIKERLEKKESK